MLSRNYGQGINLGPVLYIKQGYKRFKEGPILRNKSSLKVRGTWIILGLPLPHIREVQVGWASSSAETATVFPFSKSGKREGENDFVITQFRPAAVVGRGQS